MTEALVEAGFSAVLGWALPVVDTHASIAAAALYELLAAGKPVHLSVAMARQLLLEAESPDWHLLRLYKRHSSHRHRQPRTGDLSLPFFGHWRQDHDRASHPEFEKLAKHAGSMLFACAQAKGVDEEGFATWLEGGGLNDPERFLPALIVALEARVDDGDWLFDRGSFSR